MVEYRHDYPMYFCVVKILVFRANIYKSKKMKKILISTVIAILTVCGLYAQDVKFGVRGGLNLPNLMAGSNKTPLSEGYKSRLAPGWGIFSELKINSTVSFRFGAEYSGMGGKKDGMQAMPTGRLFTAMGGSMALGMTSDQQMALGGLMKWAETTQYYYADIKNTAKFDYMMIPLLVQLGRDLGTSPWHVYVNGGPFVSFLLSGKQASKGISKMYADPSGTSTLWDVMPNEMKFGISEVFPQMESMLNDPVKYGEHTITGELKSVNFGVSTNVGIRYQLGHNYIFLEAGGNYGFFTVQEKDIHGSNRIGAASIMAGYAFSLF